MIVVGLSGYAGAGKDSVADILVRDHGFTKMAFADQLKLVVEILDPILGFHQEQCCDCDECEQEIEEVRLSTLLAYGMTQEEIKRDFMYGPELRRVWQYVGTDIVRAIDEDYWVNRSFEALKETTAERIVFTDVRFENEADAIFSMREWAANHPPETIEENTHLTSVWRIARPDQHPDTVHVSEQMIGLLDEEVTILNDGTLAELEEPVALAMDLLLQGIYPGQTAINLDELAEECGLMDFEIEGWEWNDNNVL